MESLITRDPYVHFSCLLVKPLLLINTALLIVGGLLNRSPLRWASLVNFLNCVQSLRQFWYKQFFYFNEKKTARNWPGVNCCCVAGVERGEERKEKGEEIGERSKGSSSKVCLSFVLFSPSPPLPFQFCACQTLEPLQSLSPNQNRNAWNFVKKKNSRCRIFEIAFYIFLMKIIRRRKHL